MNATGAQQSRTKNLAYHQNMGSPLYSATGVRSAAQAHELALRESASRIWCHVNPSNFEVWIAGENAPRAGCCLFRSPGSRMKTCSGNPTLATKCAGSCQGLDSSATRIGLLGSQEEVHLAPTPGDRKRVPPENAAHRCRGLLRIAFPLSPRLFGLAVTRDIDKLSGKPEICVSKQFCSTE